jgi:glycosyltransferase involved in cell wall biosynthesis
MSSCGVLHITSLPGGGVDRHVRDIASVSPRRHLVWHTAPGADVIEIAGEKRYLPLDAHAVEREPQALASWLRNEGVGLIHAHSVNPSVRARATWATGALGARSIVTLHDLLFLRRDSLELLTSREIDAAWIAATGPFLRDAAAVLAPSEFIAAAARANLAGLAVSVVPNGIAPRQDRPAAARPGFAAQRPRHVVAVVGAIGPHKGSDLLVALDALLRDSEIAIVVVGYVDRQITPGWLGERLYVHGAYDEDELAGLLRAYGAELVLFPNPVPEAFSYALSEVWAAGIPALVPPEGALAERVSRHGGGWLLPAGFDAAAVDATLRRLLGDAAELARVKSRLTLPDAGRVPTLDAMTRSLDALYAQFGIPPGPVDAASPQVQKLLAANLDSALFRQELVRLADDFSRTRAEALHWIAKLEGDIATLQATLTAEVEERRRLGQENIQLGIHKKAFDLLPEIIRKLLLKKIVDARS